MKKGIVMQIDEAYLTLLTPEGEFLRARKQDQPYVIGEEIHFFPVETSQTYKSSIFTRLKIKKSIWITGAALILFFSSSIPIYQNNKAYAYMSIDVNPSIELGVNKNMQVVELTGFNEEGKKIISELEGWKKHEVAEVAEDILEIIKDEGYLENNDQIIISTVLPNETEEKLEKKLENNLQEIKTTLTEQDLDLQVVTGTEQDLEKAHELGITAGLYQSGSKNSNAKTKENKKEKTKEDNKSKSENNQTANTEEQQSSTDKVPPGQLKKQSDSDVPQESKNADNSGQNSSTSAEVQSDSHIPQGQLKKTEQQQAKQNQGQAKKNEPTNEAPASQKNQSNQQKK